MNVHLIKENKHSRSNPSPTDRETLLALRADSLDIARSKLRAFRRLSDPRDASTENKLEVLAFWVEGLQRPIPPAPVPVRKHYPAVVEEI
jgi:hypothetical protein